MKNKVKLLTVLAVLSALPMLAQKFYDEKRGNVYYRYSNKIYKGFVVVGVSEGVETIYIEEQIWKQAEYAKPHAIYQGEYIDVKGIDSENGLHFINDCTKSSVKSVSFPASLQWIGTGALSGLQIKKIEIPNLCSVIGDGAFKNCMLLERVTIGTGMKQLASAENPKFMCDGAFEGCTSLRYIECAADNPLIANIYTFKGVPVDECVLVVPRGTVETYRRSPAFGVFKNIKERTYTPIGIEDVNDDSAINFNGGLLTSGKDGLSVAVYSVDGRKVVSRVLPQGESLELPGRGVYIVVADGKSRKIAY